MIYILVSIFILLSIYLLGRNTLHIEEDKMITRRSIDGKALSYSTTYYIVKYTWLHKYYIWFNPHQLCLYNKGYDSVQIRLDKQGGTEFSTKEEAQEVLDDMKSNPDKYYYYES